MTKLAPWFRFYTDTPDDQKIRSLPKGDRWIWAAVMCLAKESPEPGRLLIKGLAVSETQIADKAGPGFSAREVGLALARFVDRDMVHRDDQVWVVTHFRARQFLSDTSAARTAAWRDRLKDRHGDGDVTSQTPGPVTSEERSALHAGATEDRGQKTETPSKPIRQEATARAPAPIERARALAIPKPDLMGPSERALSRALAAALGCDEPTTASEGRKWLGAIREMVGASPPVSQGEVPRLVDVFREINSVVCTPQGIVNQLSRLRSDQPATRPNGRPKREDEMAQAERIARSRLTGASM